VSLVHLEFLTDDENLIQLCTLYWQIDQVGTFAYKVADLARNFGLSTNELSKRVKNSCKALSTANFCDECGTAYVYSSRTDIQNLLRYPTRLWVCEDCTKRKEAREKAVQAALIERKRKLVQQIFSLDQMEEIDARTLTLEDIIYLISVVRLGAAEDFSFIRPLRSITDLLSPRRRFDYDILKRLYRKGVIFVHPNSDIEAFKFEGEECKSFDLDKVFWMLSAGINGISAQRFIADAEDLLKTDEWPEVWREEAYILWKQIVLEECLQYLEMVLEEHKLPFNPGEKTHLMFRQLLEEYSVAQAYNFI
jgi:DNA-directed RNA polymerase subunit M/transcription elongation factor TFIIS